ncbi:MAG: DUF2799 domain-containing protein [Myxococcota bacterium]
MRLSFTVPFRSARVASSDCRDRKAFFASSSALIAVIPLVAVMGCAGRTPEISETQCKIGDWETLGERDGALGVRSSKLLELQETCIEYGVKPDRATYMAGWERGVRDYCSPSNAFAVGESGRRHNNVCPEDLREEFAAAFGKGQSLSAARTAITEKEAAIQDGTERLEVVRKEVISTAAAQINPILTPSKRAELLAELQGLNDEKKRLTADIPLWRNELVTLQRELDVLEREMGSAGY